MTKAELIDFFKNHWDITFSANHTSFFVLHYDDVQIISESGTGDNREVFESAEDMVNNYMIEGRPLIDCAEDIKIIEFT